MYLILRIQGKHSRTFVSAIWEYFLFSLLCLDAWGKNGIDQQNDSRFHSQIFLYRRRSVEKG